MGFERGDRVQHPKRPEWGAGQVRKVEAMVHEGQPAQRVTVDFANKGRVVINTGVVPLEGKGTDTNMTSIDASALKNADRGWLDNLEQSRNGNELWSLPASLSDPFASEAQRLRATLDTFRYSTEPRALMDWAVAQTGLDDPLSKYTRQELEQAFPRYARDRNNHLFDLVRQMKRNGQKHLVQQAQRETRLPAARSALDKAMRA